MQFTALCVGTAGVAEVAFFEVSDSGKPLIAGEDAATFFGDKVAADLLEFEVAARLRDELKEIKEVAVIGVPDEVWGEVGCAVVCLNKNQTLTYNQLKNHCSKNLAKFKIPFYLVVVALLPRSATGKVLKFELRDTIPAQLNHQ